MKSVANRNLRGMSLDRDGAASYNRHYIYIVRVYVKRRLAIQERYGHVIRSV